MKTKITVLPAILAISCVSFLASCSTVSERPILAQVAVQYATIKVLENNPEHAPRVVEIARFVRENAGNSTASSVALLEAAVRAQIKWEKLDPADTVLVDLLIVTVRDELTARLGDGPLSPEQALVVAQVAAWIESAALMAQPKV